MLVAVGTLPLSLPLIYMTQLRLVFVFVFFLHTEISIYSSKSSLEEKHQMI